ncbi:MAG: UDP-N-acetylmuramate dehydrogenase [Candidatus Latescibacterota bacterium]
MKTEQIEEFMKEAVRIIPEGVVTGELLSRHTTIAVGGPAGIFASPASIAQVTALINLAGRTRIEYMVIGKGSNLLVRDGGYDGLVIKFANNLSKIKINKFTVRAEAGVSFSLLGRRMTRLHRTGLEFAMGIPGSVGGAVRMNAGSWGHDVSRILRSVKLMDEHGNVTVMKGTDIKFAYRKSGLHKKAIVLAATFNCPPGEVDQEIIKKSSDKKLTQPLSQKSFGSTFVNPPGDYAGRLLEACGLKGTRRGGAMISDKHANFIVNVGPDTTAGDVEALIEFAKQEVKKKFGISLEPEVDIVGH